MLLEEWSFRLRFDLDLTPGRRQQGFRLVLQKDCTAEDSAATLQPVTDFSTRFIGQYFLVQTQGYAAVVYDGSISSSIEPETLFVHGLDNGQEWGRYETDGSPLGTGFFQALPSRNGSLIAVYTYRSNMGTIRVQMLEVSDTGLREMYDGPIEFTLLSPYVVWSMDDASLIFTDEMTNQVVLNVAEGTIEISNGDVPSCMTLYPPSASDAYRMGASCVVDGQERARTDPLC